MDLEVLKIASDTNNNRYIKNYTHSSKLKNPLCGDEIQIKLIIKGNKILDFGYEDKSCIYCKASASLLAKNSINQQKLKINELCDDVRSYFEKNDDIIKKKWVFLKKLLNQENFNRKECILLPFKTLKKIVSN
ncbi:iron-sulfur cluster assembly scaffold protein [Pelagibacterales bacterium SAG-MED47]|nr:iron-sulfur cluster assembly scaffold protein [Pelagibacterales bacterium SAG-MED47]